MKTKIMLGILVILSISFIGMARPVSSEACTAEAIVTDSTVMQPPVVFLGADVSTQDQEMQEQEKKEKKKEEQKAKEEKEKTMMVWTAKKGEKGVIHIIIDGKGEKKIIELTAPYVLTIKETPDKTIVLTSPHLELKKGEEGTWTVKSDKLHGSVDVHTIKLDKGAVFHMRTHGEEGDTKKVIVSPHVQVHTNVKVHPNVKVHSDVEAHSDVAVIVKNEIYKKQIEEIREVVKRLKEQDLDATEKKQELERIEKALEKLNKRLEERSKSEHAFSYRIHTAPVHIEVRHKESGEAEKDVYGLLDDEGTFSIYFRGELGEEHKDAFEKVVKRLKENLPEGYEVTTDYDEGKDSFSIKITGGEEIDETSDLVKKLIKVLKEELEKIKK